jgi:heptosyltransferase-2
LIRGVNWLGDAVLSTPAVQRLREHFPRSSITLLTHEKLAPLWAHHPAIDTLLTFGPSEPPWTVGRRLRRNGFDLAIIFPNSPRSALEAWFARIPHRVGYARPWRNWLLTCAVPVRPGHVEMRKRTPGEIRKLIRNPAPRPPLPAEAHHVFEYLHLAGALGAVPDPLPPSINVERDSVAAVVRRFDLPPAFQGPPALLALNPGAEYGPAKRWPVQNFIDTAREVHRHTGFRWLIVGGRADVPLAAAIQTSLGPEAVLQNLAGRTSLGELCAVLKLCRVLLTNDTGPMHIAAALGVPVVAPFGSTSPVLTGPGLPNDTLHRVLCTDVTCSPCFLRTCPIDFRCMKTITAIAVTDAIMQTLRAGEPG